MVSSDNDLGVSVLTRGNHAHLSLYADPSRCPDLLPAAAAPPPTPAGSRPQMYRPRPCTPCCCTWPPRPAPLPRPAAPCSALLAISPSTTPWRPPCPSAPSCNAAS